MSRMVSQITGVSIVYSTVYPRNKSKKTPKLRVTGLCAGNSPVTGEFPAQRASNGENVPFDDVIMLKFCWLVIFLHFYRPVLLFKIATETLKNLALLWMLTKMTL